MNSNLKLKAKCTPNTTMKEQQTIQTVQSPHGGMWNIYILSL